MYTKVLSVNKPLVFFAQKFLVGKKQTPFVLKLTEKKHFKKFQAELVEALEFIQKIFRLRAEYSFKLNLLNKKLFYFNMYKKGIIKSAIFYAVTGFGLFHLFNAFGTSVAWYVFLPLFIGFTTFQICMYIIPRVDMEMRANKEHPAMASYFFETRSSRVFYGKKLNVARLVHEMVHDLAHHKKMQRNTDRYLAETIDTVYTLLYDEERFARIEEVGTLAILIKRGYRYYFHRNMYKDYVALINKINTRGFGRYYIEEVYMIGTFVAGICKAMKEIGLSDEHIFGFLHDLAHGAQLEDAMGGVFGLK